MKKYSFVFGIVIVFLASSGCFTKQVSLNVINVNQAQGIRKYSTIYTLPKTIVRVQVKVEKTTFKKGPYYQYASSLLGLTDVIEEDLQKWSIAEIEFEPYAVADTNQMYLIEAHDESNLVELKFSHDNFLEAISPDKSSIETKINLNDDVDNWEKKNFGARKIGNNEITFNNVPLPKELYTKKSTGEEAAFLANKILTLRDDRAAILVGDGYTETIPAGDALKTMISSIDSVQEKYLSMFKGKSKSDYYYYSFDFIPNEARKKTQSILFRFSEQFGIVDNNDVSGMPMIIELESFENLKPYDQFKKRQGFLIKLASKKGLEIEKDKGLFYRIPEIVIARIIGNDKILSQKQLQIPQFGSVHSIPVKYLDGSYTIELYPELGALKSIVKKENENIEKKK